MIHNVVNVLFRNNAR